MAGRKKKSGGGDEGAPMWIVTFSDLMSLLLTFFVLLLSFSTITEDEFNQAMMSLQGALGVLPRFSSVVAPHAPSRASKGANEDSKRAARQLRRMLQVKGLEKQVKIEYDAFGGLKISLPNAVLFGPGSATLQADAYPLMEDMGEVLGSMPETFIEIRGHTDSSPLTTASTFRDNYDLSYFRAYEVGSRLSQAGGLPWEQFELVACGSSQPMASNETEGGRVANRRVEIYVRGLVDKNRVESLEGGELGEGAAINRVLDPVGPSDLEPAR
jgi:chemotaxis protein MotB